MRTFIKLSFLLSFVLINFIGFSQSKVIALDDESFKEKVFDYEKEKEWVFKGDRPVIVDFYATWCGPCKQVAPVLEDLQKEYGDAIQIYKVNTDKAKAVSAAFGIRSLPSFLFIPVKGEPQMAKGAFRKETFVKILSETMSVRQVVK